MTFPKGTRVYCDCPACDGLPVDQRTTVIVDYVHGDVYFCCYDEDDLHEGDKATYMIHVNDAREYRPETEDVTSRDAEDEELFG